MQGNYKVITLCGSTRFKNEFMEAQKKLTLDGNIVISVGLFGHSGDSEAFDEATKTMLDDIHFRKIDMSDEIYVINVGGYIGKSTTNEIKYALEHNKPVYFLENEDGIPIIHSICYLNLVIEIPRFEERIKNSGMILFDDEISNDIAPISLSLIETENLNKNKVIFHEESLQDSIEKITKDLFGEMRDLTIEEQEAYSKGLDKIFKSTGVNLFDDKSKSVDNNANTLSILSSIYNSTYPYCDLCGNNIDLPINSKKKINLKSKDKKETK